MCCWPESAVREMGKGYTNISRLAWLCRKIDPQLFSVFLVPETSIKSGYMTIRRGLRVLAAASLYSIPPFFDPKMHAEK